MLKIVRESNQVRGYLKAFFISIVTTAIITVIFNIFIPSKLNDEENNILSLFIMYKKGIVGIGSVMLFITLQSILAIKFTLMEFHNYERVDSSGKTTYTTFFLELNELRKFYTGHSWGVMVAYILFVFIFSASEVEYFNLLFLASPFVFAFMLIILGAFAENFIDSYIKHKKKELKEYIAQQEMDSKHHNAL